MAFTRKFYTGDTHFGHQLMGAEHATARPFPHTRAMDEALIRNWNEVVGDDDLVYHVGDFAFGLHDADRVRWVFDQLKGRKVLVLGNHDYAGGKPRERNKVHPTLAALGWEEIAQQYDTTDEGEHVFLSHYAQRTWPHVRKGGWHFYGHNHGKLPPYGRSRDVGMDCKDVGFAPRTFRQLTSAMREAEVRVAEEEASA